MKDGDGITEQMVKFDRASVINILSIANEVEIAITGKIAGADFKGIDLIRVIDGGKLNLSKRPSDGMHLYATMPPIFFTSFLLPFFYVEFLR